MHKTIPSIHPLIQEFHIEQPELNQKLEKLVRDEIDREKGLGIDAKHSNIGGWHSERNLDAKLADGSPRSALLIQLFESFSGPMTEYIRNNAEKFHTTQKEAYEWFYAGSWFNVAFKGSYNAPHVHPGCQISAAYYIRTEEPSKEHPFSGRIDFIDKNIQYGYFPKAGTLFLFPSDMLHWVHPYFGNDLRICLSFNAKKIS